MPNQSLTERLATILAELASLPDAEARIVTADAISSAHTDVGCGMREDLAIVVVQMAEQVTDICHADQADLENFYFYESTSKDTEHLPADCRKWSRDHGKARDAYGKANLALLKTRTDLAKRIRKAGL
jgi:hypothetical protein